MDKKDLVKGSIYKVYEIKSKETLFVAYVGREPFNDEFIYVFRYIKDIFPHWFEDEFEIII